MTILRVSTSEGENPPGSQWGWSKKKKNKQTKTNPSTKSHILLVFKSEVGSLCVRVRLGSAALLIRSFSASCGVT